MQYWRSLPQASARIVAEPAGAQAQQALGLGVEGMADDVEVQTVLVGLRLRHLVERHAWPAGIAVAREQDRMLGSGSSATWRPRTGPGQRHRRSQR
jgi:hypothetical protein